jgi:hypothetical protein
VLYVRDTTDEAIYEKQNWERLVGLDRNRYFHWEPPAAPIEQEGPPRTPIPSEEEIDLSALAVGDAYPGRYRGEEFSTDRLGNVVAPGGAVALNPQEVPATVEALRGDPGRFRVTPHASALLVRVPVQSTQTLGRHPDRRPLIDDPVPGQLALAHGAETWVTLFGGVLEEPFRFPEADSVATSVDVARLAPGDIYNGPLEPAIELRFRRRSGGVIAKRVPGGELLAQGPNAERLLVVLRERLKVGVQVTRIYVNELGHAFWREEGIARFLAALDGELEFPEQPA